MRMQLLLSSLALGALLLAQPVRGETVFFEIGDLPGGLDNSRANAVTDDGSVVVGSSNSTNGVEAILWTELGGSLGLGAAQPVPAFFSTARGVSADGSVVVGDTLVSGNNQAARWVEEVLDVLGDLDGGQTQSRALDVSDDGGTIVGWGNSEAGREAFAWTEATGFAPLGDLAGGDFDSQALDVSSDGSVIVGSGASEAGTEAFRWTMGTGLVGLGDLDGGAFESTAKGVSADGAFVVGQGESAAGPEAFLWSQASGMVGLGIPMDAIGSDARAVSDDGSVVVGSISSGMVPIDEAFIWDAQNGIRVLQDVLETDHGLDLSDWTRLTVAQDVSGDGRAITGFGVKAETAFERGFLVILPEPGAALLHAAALLALAGLRRHGRDARLQG